MRRRNSSPFLNRRCRHDSPFQYNSIRHSHAHRPTTLPFAFCSTHPPPIHSVFDMNGGVQQFNEQPFHPDACATGTAVRANTRVTQEMPFSLAMELPEDFGCGSAPQLLIQTYLHQIFWVATLDCRACHELLEHQFSNTPLDPWQRSVNWGWPPSCADPRWTPGTRHLLPGRHRCPSDLPLFNSESWQFQYATASLGRLSEPKQLNVSRAPYDHLLASQFHKQPSFPHAGDTHRSPVAFC